MVPKLNLVQYLYGMLLSRTSFKVDCNSIQPNQSFDDRYSALQQNNTYVQTPKLVYGELASGATSILLRDPVRLGQGWRDRTIPPQP